jgi:hypothetical protein
MGLVNVAHKVDGVQIGLVNHAGQLRGVQIGLINHAEDGVLAWTALLNMGFGDGGASLDEDQYAEPVARRSGMLERF